MFYPRPCGDSRPRLSSQARLGSFCLRNYTRPPLTLNVFSRQPQPPAPSATLIPKHLRKRRSIPTRTPKLQPCHPVRFPAVAESSLRSHLPQLQISLLLV